VYVSSTKLPGSSKVAAPQKQVLTLGIWAIVKNWLDPVVASKIHFTRSAADLEKFIPRDRIVKELEGDEPYEWMYIEPVPGENDMMKDTEARDKIQAERDEMVRRFEESTGKWIAGEEGAGTERDEIAKELNENYWRLDPYVRARTVYDRVGAIGPQGGFVYSKNEPATSSNAEEAKPIAEGDKEETAEPSTQNA
jgi:CRAL/TRIO domain